MNVYKLSVQTQGYFLIEKNDYEQRTARRPPWYKMSDDGEPRYFAICPACNNPTQIIGLYKLPANVYHPYAKHYGKPISGVGIYDKEAYEWCPYSNRKPASNGNKPKRLPSVLTQQILSILVTHFDKVVWLLSQSTGISIDEKLARKMLEQYRREDGWLYSRATLMNIPWAFAYMTDNQDILFKKFGDITLANELVTRAPEILEFTDKRYLIKQKTCKEYIELGAYYTLHQSRVVDDVLTESMDMVFTLKKGYREPLEIYRQTISFDFEHFNNLVNFSEWKTSPWNEQLLQLAREILGDLIA
ncbi:hypothetical protein [Salmonella enterica]|uniref:hypothetical protein n=1 Tax=Salmonella enterica TaxID=28901 RepID=UPI0003BD5D22|nr:hypothetical protein [Salmonella enterica]APV87151.1 hypothetical protein SEEM1958_003895 [Salmonella enterica subsp. enterica serovar Mbandaka str. ATCC 51958]EBF8300121.1 hypothetical protein [Salmonella enterica subsp. enterica serovar Mbandaka]